MFVAQEEDDSNTYSTRVAGLDLLTVRINSRLYFVATNESWQCLVDRAPARTAATLQATIQQTISTSSQARDAGKGDW